MQVDKENRNSEGVFKHAYAGSFDPWTKGHQSVVESFLKKDADANIEIIIGKNPNKKNQLFCEADRSFIIRQGISDDYSSRIRVSIVEGVIADYMYEQNIPYMIKGVRDEKDFREELNLAGINSQLFGSPMTLLIPQVQAGLGDVSSSNFKLLGNLGIPMDRYANAFTRELLKMKTKGKLFIGVTGGIASGKSTFCKKLAEYSARGSVPVHIINMDELGHVVLESQTPIPLFTKARHQIARLFGSDVIMKDETVNRQILGRKVFGKPHKLAALTALLSEPIMYLLAKRIRSVEAGIVMIESAILIERNVTELVDDNIIHVHTNRNTQISRMKEFRNLSESQAEKRINSQLSARELEENITRIQRDNFDRLYISIDTSSQLSPEEVSTIYEQLVFEYNRRKEVRRTNSLFIPEDIQIRDDDLFFQQIEQYYETPERAYHNLTHIAEMLTLFQTYKDLLTHPGEVYLAILLHDAVYDVAEKDNEMQSALTAEEFIRFHFSENDIDLTLVKKLIELTAFHGKDLSDYDEEAKLFLDMDMAILAAPRKRLLEYEEGVFLEYSQVYSKEAYIKGRREFLESILKKDQPLYLTSLFQEKYESRAVDNIHYLLGILNSDNSFIDT